MFLIRVLLEAFGSTIQALTIRFSISGASNSPSRLLINWPGIPRPKESWDAIGRRKKEDLIKPKDIKGLLRRCHNKLHGRGVEGEEEDLTMDMVRLILAKAQDEEQSGEYPTFYCTPEEYSTEDGRSAVAERVRSFI